VRVAGGLADIARDGRAPSCRADGTKSSTTIARRRPPASTRIARGNQGDLRDQSLVRAGERGPGQPRADHDRSRQFVQVVVKMRRVRMTLCVRSRQGSTRGCAPCQELRCPRDSASPTRERARADQQTGNGKGQEKHGRQNEGMGYQVKGMTPRERERKLRKDAGATRSRRERLVKESDAQGRRNEQMTGDGQSITDHRQLISSREDRTDCSRQLSRSRASPSRHHRTGTPSCAGHERL